VNAESSAVNADNAGIADIGRRDDPTDGKP
jgi:hypothetical protein